METNNSLDQGLFLELFSSLVEDVADATHCPTSEVLRDLKEIRKRCTYEGFSFLTKTLPSLGKALDKALLGKGPLVVPTHFKCTDELPNLFRWWFANVFTPEGNLRCPFVVLRTEEEPKGLTYRIERLDPNGLGVQNCNGMLFSPIVRTKCDRWGERQSPLWYTLDDPEDPGFIKAQALMDSEIASIRALRQVLYYLYKLEIPVTEETETLCLDSFEQVDRELSEFSIVRSEYIIDCCSAMTSIFDRFDYRNIRPSHGPGAVATGEKNHEKHDFSRIYSAIESVYPFTDYYVYSMAAVCDDYARYELLEELESGTTKVVLVPKDSRGPRIISCEPLEYQWIQQGLGRAIMAWLEDRKGTSGMVNFTSQQVNRDLSLSASIDQQWVTLDMKEASDRVSVQLIQHLFAANPPLLNALLATRSPKAMLPSGRVVHLNKFATMGSCLCFPVQAIVFFVLAVVAIRRVYHLSREDAMRCVYVFGDDIIVDRRYYPALLQYLPTVGLRFNEGKCCTDGFFRESCGCDAYKGVDVTPLRLKTVWYHNRENAKTIESYVEHSNAAYDRGYKRLAYLTGGLVQRAIGELPQVPRKWSKRPYLALHRDVSVFQPGPCRMRYNRNLQRWELRAWTSRTPVIQVPSDAWSMILRRFAAPSDIHAPGVFAVSRSNCLNRGWTPT